MLERAAFLNLPDTVSSELHVVNQLKSERFVDAAISLAGISCAKCAVLMLNMLILIAAEVAEAVSSSVRGVHSVNNGFGPILPIVMRSREVTLQ
jgi:hypothetical protein